MTGHAPAFVNAHQHVNLFPPVGAILRSLLATQRPRPYLRRVREPMRLMGRLSGARCKRAGLTLLGRREARRQERAGFPGADWLAGIGSPCAVPGFLLTRLEHTPGRLVELMCHPGWPDPTLEGRDVTQPRCVELHNLAAPAFLAACRRAGFRLARPSESLEPSERTVFRVA
jgi:predicted glycoside hydrolase/deacetylase ChbG (UPF0249 family)